MKMMTKLMGAILCAAVLAIAGFMCGRRGTDGREADLHAVERLVVAERLYRSSHRDAELSACYAPDAAIRTSWQRGGLSSFVGKAPPDGLRPSYRFLALVRRLAGGEANPDELGTDRPDEVARFYDGEFSWLAGTESP